MNDEKPVVRMACKHCGAAQEDHGPDSKCLFEATQYVEGDVMLVDVTISPQIPIDLAHIVLAKLTRDLPRQIEHVLKVKDPTDE